MKVLVLTLALLLQLQASDGLSAAPRCPGCGCDGSDLESGCDGSGRVIGGLGAYISWMPKAYRPCPKFVEAGGIYEKVGGSAPWESNEEIGFDSLAKQRAFAFDNNEVTFTIKIQQDPGGYVAVGDGTGKVTWGSAFVLADLLQRSEQVSSFVPEFPDNLQTRSVVELGAGLGLCSIVCSKVGAKSVVSTDGSESILQLLQRNADANLSPREQSTLETRQLKWGDAAAAADLLKSEILATGIDVVLMADVAYQRNAAAWPLLVQTVTTLTEEQNISDASPKRSPVVLWAHAARDDESRVDSDRFRRDLMAPLRRLFLVNQVDSALLHPAYRKSNVSVYVLKRR